MMRSSTAARACATAFLMMTCYAGIGGAQQQLATGEAAEVTADGLHRVDPGVMEAAWIRPDLDLSAYTKVFLLPVRVQFREVSEVSEFNRVRGGGESFPVDAGRRVQFGELWGQALYGDVAALDSFELVTEVGRDVLLVQGSLVDVISGIPPESARGGGATVLYPWTASVVLEVRDAMSDDLLARTADRRRIEGPLDATAVWTRTGTLLKRWSQLVCERLETLDAVAAP